MTDFQVSISDNPMGAGDIPPDSQNFNDGQFHCETCGTTLIYAGRGRHPRFCDDHKPNKSTSPGTRNSNMKALEESLANMYRGLGMGISMVDGFSGMAIASAADDLAASWILLANSNPNVKKFLVKLTTGGGVGAVLIAHAMVAFPIAQHHNLVPSFAKKRNTGYGDTGP